MSNPTPTEENASPVSEFDQAKEAWIRQLPAPTFWLFGKTQSGKTSILRYLTGADAEIGFGFRPTTRQSSTFDFPNEENPILRVLDTRGIGEISYDADEDIDRFHQQAQLVLVTVRVNDMSVEPLMEPLRKMRASQPTRPMLLILTCLHFAYPGQQHPPYPFTHGLHAPEVEPTLARMIDHQEKTFGSLVNAIVPIDLTRPEEGFEQLHYGGEHLKQMILHYLPEGYRQAFFQMPESLAELRKHYTRQASSFVQRYAMMAGGAGMIPIPFVDLPAVAGLQTKMVYDLAQVYGQAPKAGEFLKLAGILGASTLGRAALRQVAKVVPWLGSVVGGGSAYATTYAIGQAACWYFGEVLGGHLPRREEVERVLADSFLRAKDLWGTPRK